MIKQILFKATNDAITLRSISARRVTKGALYAVMIPRIHFLYYVCFVFMCVRVLARNYVCFPIIMSALSDLVDF